jgi:hypothetical protein
MPIDEVQLLQTRVDTVLSVVDTNRVSKEIAIKAVEGLPILDSIVSTEDFYNKCKQIFEATRDQRRLIAGQQHQFKRAQVQNMAVRAFSDNIIEIEPEGTTYDSWFMDRNIDINSFSKEDLNAMYVELTREATGLALNNETSLKELQSAMLKMLGQLTSYSVQVIGDINETDIIKTDITTIRVGDVDTETIHDVQHPPIVVELIDTSTSVSHEVDMRHRVIRTDSFNISLGSKVKMEIPIKINDVKVIDLQVIKVPRIKLTVQPQVPIPENAKGIIPVPGIPEYLLLTEEEQQSFVSIYTGDYSGTGSTNYIEPGYIDTDYYTVRGP